MKIKLIKNDDQCIEQLNLYFDLLLKADKLQLKIEKTCSAILQKDHAAIPQRVIKSYHKLNSLGRMLTVVKSSIEYYIADKQPCEVLEKECI